MLETFTEKRQWNPSLPPNVSALKYRLRNFQEFIPPPLRVRQRTMRRSGARGNLMQKKEPPKSSPTKLQYNLNLSSTNKHSLVHSWMKTRRRSRGNSNLWNENRDLICYLSCVFSADIKPTVRSLGTPETVNTRYCWFLQANINKDEEGRVYLQLDKANQL